VLVLLLRGPDAAARMAADRCLRGKGPLACELIPAFTESLHDANADVRKEAAESFGELGAEAKPAVTALAELLQDPDDNVRIATIYALERIGLDAAEAVPALNEMLRSEKDNWVRQTAASALEKIRPAKPGGEPKGETKGTSTGR
jgi:HEAT repeat protein